MKGLLAQLDKTVQDDDSNEPLKAFQARADGRDSFPSMDGKLQFHLINY